MRKILLPILFLASFIHASAKVDLDSMLNALDRTVERRDVFYMTREHRIDSLKQILRGGDSKVSDPVRVYEVYNRIFDEYKSYQFDSALVYAMKLHGISSALRNDTLNATTNCNLIFCYLSSGLFTEACDIANKTDLSNLPDAIKAEFYFLCIRLYSDMSNYSNGTFTDKYADLSYAYCDSTLRAVPAGHFYHVYAAASKLRVGIDERIRLFCSLLEREDIDNGWKAMLASIVADQYRAKNDMDNAIYYKALSSVLDTESAKRETTAKKDLALYLYERGDIDRASRYIELALEDATFYNSRHRKIEISTVMPLIETARFYSVANQRNTLYIIVAVISLLLLLLAAAIAMTIKQMRKVKNAHRTIEERNGQIERRNDRIERQNQQLQATNALLQESNSIKDEYIGYAFFLNSEYIGKMEALYKLVNRKLAARQYDDLRMSLKEGDLKREKGNMLVSFDGVFLKLFPSFIRSYNKLFASTEPPCPENSKELTPEMRIFALIRLGISDSNKIANILNYSVNTVNTYKTKAKNRSIVPNEQFEQKIMEIKSVS